MLSLKNPTDLAMNDIGPQKNNVNTHKSTDTKNETESNQFDKKLSSEEQKITVIDSKTMSNISNVRYVEG